MTRVLAADAGATGVRISSIKASSGSAKVGGECPAPAFSAGGCTIGTLDAGKRDSVNSSVTLPKTLKRTTAVTLTVTVSSTNAAARSASTKVSFVVPKKTATKKPAATKSPAAGSGAGSGSGGAPSSSAPAPYSPPAPNGTFSAAANTAKNPQVALPPMAAAPSPSVAPSTGALQAAQESRLRGNPAPIAQEITFDRVAVTQGAWLAALLVGFGLLLTQLRLGRRTLSPEALEAARRARGVHRRTRRGTFGR
ncbi:hypothetical protein [Actinomadura parmotrematis]|uniref:Uncharacterized protein n=1 Tax=Actinomadura parmotrematis TaxID=2864039 RepID=A0ABS7G136_9ACTN|nr:hypothetical protein [Actinomadura parmotrematis]MBW8486427.1 hypothetical protein [Actinomadura parmotrematis]